MLRLAFMGTPAFSVPVLAEILAAGHDVAAVYSQPPRPAGRGHKEQKSPVHVFAEQHGLTVRTPRRLKSAEDQAAFAALDLDVAIVVAYGLILPKPILDAPRHGCLNLHASLLPRWRGAAPIQRAIMAGDKETGVMVMQMEEGLDTGPVLLGERVAITDTMTAGQLHDTLSQVGASLMTRALAALERGGLTPQPQPDEGVTYAHKIEKEEGRIDWTRSASEIDRQIRGLNPFPGAWFEIPCADGSPVRVKVLKAKTTKASGVPGSVFESGKSDLVIACGDGGLAVMQIQRAGKSPCTIDAFLCGFDLPVGTQL